LVLLWFLVLGASVCAECQPGKRTGPRC